MTDEERVLALRMVDEKPRLRAICELRWKLLEIMDELNDDQFYIDANELLTEMEKRIWKLIETGKYDG